MLPIMHSEAPLVPEGCGGQFSLPAWAEYGAVLCTPAQTCWNACTARALARPGKAASRWSIMGEIFQNNHTLAFKEDGQQEIFTSNNERKSSKTPA